MLSRQRYCTNYTRRPLSRLNGVRTVITSSVRGSVAGHEVVDRDFFSRPRRTISAAIDPVHSMRSTRRPRGLSSSSRPKRTFVFRLLLFVSRLLGKNDGRKKKPNENVARTRGGFAHGRAGVEKTGTAVRLVTRTRRPSRAANVLKVSTNDRRDVITG